MVSFSIPKLFLYEGPLGTTEDWSRGLVPCGPSLFPYDLPTPAKVGAKERAFRQQDTVHMTASALWELGWPNSCRGPASNRKLATMDELLCHGEKRGWSEWGRPLSHGWGAGRRRKTWPPGSSGKSEPACRGWAVKKEKLQGKEKTTVNVPSFTSLLFTQPHLPPL